MCIRDRSMPAGSVLTGLRLGGVSGGVVTVNVYNNVFANNRCEVVGSTDVMGMLYVGGYTTINFKNNILKDPVGSYSYFVLTSGTSVSYTASNNCYHTTGDNNRWSWVYSDKTTLAEWESASGETSSINQDPLFLDASNSNYRLQSSSPCIDAGTDVGLTEDFGGNPVPQGSAPDMGAYEYQNAYEGTETHRLANFNLNTLYMELGETGGLNVYVRNLNETSPDTVTVELGGSYPSEYARFITRAGDATWASLYNNNRTLVAKLNPQMSRSVRVVVLPNENGRYTLDLSATSSIDPTISDYDSVAIHIRYPWMFPGMDPSAFMAAVLIAGIVYWVAKPKINCIRKHRT